MVIRICRKTEPPGDRQKSGRGNQFTVPRSQLRVSQKHIQRRQIRLKSHRFRLAIVHTVLGNQLFREQIARDLLPDKRVEGLIHVVRVNHVIAIEVRLRHRKIGGLTSRIRVADHVQPMPAPFLSVRGRPEQTVKLAFI